MAETKEADDPRIDLDRQATAEARAVEDRDGRGDGRRANEPEVNKLFRAVMKFQASDLHLKVGQPPMMRLRGDIRRADLRPLTQ